MLRHLSKLFRWRKPPVERLHASLDPATPRKIVLGDIGPGQLADVRYVDLFMQTEFRTDRRDDSP